MKRKYYFIFLSSILYLLFSGFSHADIVAMKDGQEINGIVVEEYKDRVVLSTFAGEKTIQKADIKELYFDSYEENLIKLAEQAKDRRDFGRAFTYYNLALKKNPDSKAANDGLIFLQGYLFRKEESEKLEDIKRRENVERYGTIVELGKAKTGEDRDKELAARLKDLLGLTLEIEKGFPKITGVRLKSPAYEAGMRKGDLLIALWGKLTGYMSLTDIVEIMADKPLLEIKCTVERPVSVEPGGAAFTMETKGLTVSGVKEGSPAFDSGLKKDDLIVAINGSATRYMPLKKALGMIKKTRGKAISLTLRREILIWRGEAI